MWVVFYLQILDNIVAYNIYTFKGCVYMFYNFLYIVILLLFIFIPTSSIIWQVYITKSGNHFIWKFIANMLYFLFAPILPIVLWIYVLIKTDPSGGAEQGAGWLLVMYVLFSPVTLVVGLTILGITHFLTETTTKKNKAN